MGGIQWWSAFRSAPGTLRPWFEAGISHSPAWPPLVTLLQSHQHQLCLRSGKWFTGVMGWSWLAVPLVGEPGPQYLCILHKDSVQNRKGKNHFWKLVFLQWHKIHREHDKPQPVSLWTDRYLLGAASSNSSKPLTLYIHIINTKNIFTSHLYTSMTCSSQSITVHCWSLRYCSDGFKAGISVNKAFDQIGSGIWKDTLTVATGCRNVCTYMAPTCKSPDLC